MKYATKTTAEYPALRLFCSRDGVLYRMGQEKNVIMKIVRIIIISLTVIFIADLLVFANVIFSDRESDKSEPQEIIRVGIAPDKDRIETDKTISSFLFELRNQGLYEIKPCFSNSYAEAVAGFIHGSLDMILINPAYYLQLKREHNARILAVQKYSPEEKNYNHAVLLSARPIRHINLTRGLRLSYSNRYSMTGYLVPQRYLALQLPQPPGQWFSRISFAESFEHAFEDLLAGKADLIAVDLYWLKNNLKYREKAAALHILWTSQALPESLICVSFSSAYYNATVLQDITAQLWSATQKDTVFNRSSMFFEPVNFNYEMELNKLETFLYGDKK